MAKALVGKRSPAVSVIIPCYNLGKYVVEAVDSIVNQTFQDVEIIVVNDGSTDPQTNKILKDLNRPRTTVFRTENHGVARARNHGIRRSKGRFIVCLDADDYCKPTYLEKAVELLEEHSDVGIVGSYVEIFGRTTGTWEPGPFNPAELLFRNSLPVSSLFRRDCWKEAGGYKTGVIGYQDWELWISMVENGWKADIIKEHLFCYRDREESMVKSSDKVRGELIGRIVRLHASFYAKQLPLVVQFWEKRFQNFSEQSRLQTNTIELLKKSLVDREQQAGTQKKNSGILSNKIEAQTQTIESLKTRIVVLEDRLNTKNDQIRELQAITKNFDTDNRAQTQTIISLKGLLDSQSQNIEQLKGIIREHEAQLAEKEKLLKHQELLLNERKRPK